MSENFSLKKEGEILHPKTYTIEMEGKEELDLLEEKVRLFLKEDIFALSKIKPLLASKDTFSHSLGDLYRYSLDRKICVQCTGKLSSCPREHSKGYYLAPCYDKSADRIFMHYTSCPRLDEIQDILSNIIICDCTCFNLYQEANSLFKSLLAGDNIKKMQGISTVFKEALNHSKNRTVKKKGLFFSTPNGGEKLSSSLLKLIGYVYAKSGAKVVYLKAGEFFKNLFSNRLDLSQPTYEDYLKVLSSDVILLEQLDEIPYLSDEKAKKYFLPLLQNKGNRILYASFNNPAIQASFVRKYYNCFQVKKEIDSLIKDNFEVEVIQDLDLR